MAERIPTAACVASDRPFPQMAGRIEDARLLRGRGRYIDDLPVSPHTLNAAILRSPHAHALVRNIDVRAASAVKGVFAVYTGRDIATVLDPFPSIVRSAPPYRAVTIDKVRYVGEPVAVVLASDRYAAEDGLAAIEVDYEPLEAVTRPHLACEAGAPILHDELKSNVVWHQHYRYGDPDAAFAKADRVVRVALTFPKYNSTPLETYGVVAEYLPERAGFVVHGNFQGPFSLMPVMARALRVPENRLRIVVPQDVGGSFGIKAMIYPYIALMAACARLAGRPVKWIEDRMEHLLASASGTDRESELEAAVSSDGRDPCHPHDHPGKCRRLSARARTFLHHALADDVFGPLSNRPWRDRRKLRADQQAADRAQPRLRRPAIHLFAGAVGRSGRTRLEPRSS